MPRNLLIFVLVISFLVMFIQLQIFSIAFQKLGLSPESGLLLILFALLGSAVNIPLLRVDSNYDPATAEQAFRNAVFPFRQRAGYPGKTVIAVNVGGCVIPVGLCLYQLAAGLVGPLLLGAALLMVALISRLASRPIPGIGIGMPVLLAPLVAVLMAVLLEPANPAPLAFCSGVLGVLLGADILRLPDIRVMGVPFASIGGAGTFDGVFLTGIVAALLA